MTRVGALLDWRNLDASYPAFADVVAALVVRNRRLSAGLAAAYLRAVKAAQGRPGAFGLVVPELSTEDFQASLHATSVAAAKSSSARGVVPEVAMAAAVSYAAGSMVRYVLGGGRETISATLAGDPDARGWKRILGGSNPCEFCRELAGRTYSVNVQLDAHDRCGCQMQPVFI